MSYPLSVSVALLVMALHRVGPSHAVVGKDNFDHYQFWAINVGFEMYIVIGSKLSIVIIGSDFKMGKLCHFDIDCNIISIQYQYQ